MTVDSPLPDSAPSDRAIHLGCAGWSLPSVLQPDFDAGDSQLSRYASRFNAVEINSAFYRRHRHSSYERWAASTPPDFGFSVKIPKAITHELRLLDAMPIFDDFLDQVRGLGPKLRCLLVQLPPSLAFERAVAGRFAAQLRRRYQGPVALEPRHASWFSKQAETLLFNAKFARVLADPVLQPGGEAPGGWPQTVYLRLHGSPRIYWSSYRSDLLEALATRLRSAQQQMQQCWCIFDNTAAGEALRNALELKTMLALANQRGSIR